MKRSHVGAVEHAQSPQPRALWSGKTNAQVQDWLDYHEVLASEARAWSKGVVFFGDSIVERLRCTRLGKPWSEEDMRRAHGWPGPGGLEALASLVQNASSMSHPRAAPLLLGIGGDQTQHLLWRLSYGELAASMRLATDTSARIVLHIGTNNLGWGMGPEEAADGMLAVVEHILRHTRGKVLATTLLPRVHFLPWGRRDRKLPIEATNMRFRSELDASDRFAAYRQRGRLLVADCGGPFREAMGAFNSTSSIPPPESPLGALLPDGLHPSTAAYRLLFRCWEEHLAQFDLQDGRLGRNAPRGAASSRPSAQQQHLRTHQTHSDDRTPTSEQTRVVINAASEL
jgi:lysophospholipase L1-like esterase